MEESLIVSWEEKSSLPGAGIKVLDLDIEEDLEESLWATELEEKPEFKMFGRVCRMRRNIGFFSDVSDGYKFSNQKRSARPLTEEMRILLKRVNTLSGIEFNGLLFNLYLDGKDYISPHRDNKKDLTDDGVIALSLGAGRTFRIREHKSKKVVYDHVTGASELMWMYGPKFHVDYTHEVPVEKSVTEARLSITFRKHVETIQKTKKIIIKKLK